MLSLLQQRGRKRLVTPKERRQRGSSSIGSAAIAEEVCCVSGEHVCYLAVTPRLATLCVTDGLPPDQEVSNLY